MRHTLIAFTVAAALAASATALGQPVRDKGAPEDAERLIEEATRQVFRALELILQSIPQYAAPEILENGDIIIRRIHPKPQPHAPKPGNGTGPGKPI